MGHGARCGCGQRRRRSQWARWSGSREAVVAAPVAGCGKTDRLDAWREERSSRQVLD